MARLLPKIRNAIKANKKVLKLLYVNAYYQLRGHIPAGLSDKALRSLTHAALQASFYELSHLICLELLRRNNHDAAIRTQLGITNYFMGRLDEARKWYASLAHQKAQATISRPELSKYRILDGSWQVAIGHVAFISIFIKAQKMGWYPPAHNLIAYNPSKPPAGFPLFRFYRKDIEVIETAAPDDVLNQRVFEGFDLEENDRQFWRHMISRDFWSGPGADGRELLSAEHAAAVEKEWAARGGGALYELDEESRRKFRIHLEEQFGLPRDARFALVHVRESGFHSDWEKTHPSTRNASIATYDQAIDFLIGQGMWVVRCGDPSMRPVTPRKGLVDYAVSEFRAAELDILLCAECAFLLGTNSGFSLIPPIFGRPSALTNWCPIASTNPYPKDVFVPKIIRNKKTGEDMSFRQMHGTSFGAYHFQTQFDETDWDIVDNTPEQILDITREIYEEVMLGQVVVSDEVTVLRARYDQIVEECGGFSNGRLSAQFLLKNRHLLSA